MKTRWSVATSIVLVSLASGVRAADKSERILSFHSDIVVHKDGWLTVTETIKVRSRGEKIERGIYRDFPIQYAGRDLRRIIIPLKIVSVLRNGKPEPHHTKAEGVYKRIYMGDKDVRISPGVHTYKLTYRVGRELGFFEDHDELYWNVTGNEWAFPIDSASAMVLLPKGVAAKKIRHHAFTGHLNMRLSIG